jgi:hypothetical protein
MLAEHRAVEAGERREFEPPLLVRQTRRWFAAADREKGDRAALNGLSVVGHITRHRRNIGKFLLPAAASTAKRNDQGGNTYIGRAEHLIYLLAFV